MHVSLSTWSDEKGKPLRDQLLFKAHVERTYHIQAGSMVARPDAQSLHSLVPITDNNGLLLCYLLVASPYYLLMLQVLLLHTASPLLTTPH